MPYATNNSIQLYYEVDGEGYAGDAEGTNSTNTVTFCGELGFGPWQWGWQHAAVAGPYRAVIPATRGTDDSDAPPGPYTVADLVGDLDAVLSDAGVRSTHLVGVGLGGAVALTAALGSDRVRKLALVGTAAYGEGLNPDPLRPDPDDPETLASSLEAAFSREFVGSQPDVLSRIAEWRAAEDADPEAWESTRAALDSFDLTDRLYEVTNEALVLHGSEDALCPPGKGEELAEGLPRGEFEAVEGAGHLAHIEHSRTVNDRLLEFLGS
ncbi:alpha/beta fold hydrolase [Halorarum halophilum]|uniref:Alpha/beta fold hydrolase n=1 Tax=Halorarum halophilum TaxID=2743090 RepID=A0A7D5GCV2_9EURY|nr:alpha/beta fold hydrolase [Halobaculum halophilum]QLG28512.1 alpha/beta fold hydrolase [Halobaculum halophilum]